MRLKITGRFTLLWVCMIAYPKKQQLFRGFMGRTTSKVGLNITISRLYDISVRIIAKKDVHKRPREPMLK